MINCIIENKVYIGVLKQGKITKLNYKSKKEIEVHEDDWIVIDEVHEAIISKSTFALANKMLLRDLKTFKEKPPYLQACFTVPIVVVLWLEEKLRPKRT